MVVPAGYIGALLLPSEVAAIAEGVGLTTNYIDRKLMVADVDPSSVEHMDSCDSQIFDTADGSQSFYPNTIKLDSEEAATNHLALVSSETPGMQDHTTKIGDTSFLAEINEFGIGITVVFKKGFWVVVLHSTQFADSAPLVDLAGIEALAQTVSDRF